MKDSATAEKYDLSTVKFQRNCVTIQNQFVRVARGVFLTKFQVLFEKIVLQNLKPINTDEF